MAHIVLFTIYGAYSAIYNLWHIQCYLQFMAHTRIVLFTNYGNTLLFTIYGTYSAIYNLWHI